LLKAHGPPPQRTDERLIDIEKAGESCSGNMLLYIPADSVWPLTSENCSAIAPIVKSLDK